MRRPPAWASTSAGAPAPKPRSVRVAAELERARDLEREVRARLRPLSMQATAADRAAKLAGEIAVGRVTLLASEMLSRSELERRARRAPGDARAEAHAEVEASWRRWPPAAPGRGGADRPGRGAGAGRATPSTPSRPPANGCGLQAGRMSQASATLERTRGRRLAVGRPARGDAKRLAAESAGRRRGGTAAAEIARLGVGDVEGERVLTAQAEAALTAALDARRALADAQGQVTTSRREAEQSTARAGGPYQAAAGPQRPAKATAEELEGANTQADGAGEAGAAAAELRPRSVAATATARSTAAEADLRRPGGVARADPSQRAGGDPAGGLERALERGEGLPPAARSLQAAGAKLVVAGDRSPGGI